MLRYEKELIGDYLFAHPFDGFISEWQAGAALSDLGETFDKEVVEIVGAVIKRDHRMTKTNRPFTMGEVEDFSKANFYSLILLLMLAWRIN